MNKELKKAIYARSRLRNNFCKSPTNKNEKSTKYNKTNVCFLEGKVLRNILRTFRKDGVVTNKNFQSIINPFLTNKGHINWEKIILKTDNETITNTSVLAEMFNSHYINILENMSGKKSKSFCS